MEIHHCIKDGVALIEFENAPVNALSLDFVTLLGQKIAFLQDDKSIKAIILAGRGRLFSAGADIGEFDKDPVAVITALQGLNQQLNQCQKLLVMALHGAVLGGGLELALSAHIRIAAPKTRMALPEIRLGLLPGAGGTQALPRLIGLRQAYEMMMHGLPISCEQAHHIGLIDAISGVDLVGDAFALARSFLERETYPRKPWQRQIPEEERDFINFYRYMMSFQEGAKKASCLAILDCFEVAMDRSFEEGLEFEAKKFHELLGSYASRALRYGFFAGKASSALSQDQIDEIGQRMMAALARESKQLICEGIARSERDIDAIMVKNYGFSTETGGPLFWLKEHGYHDE